MRRKTRNMVTNHPKRGLEGLFFLKTSRTTWFKYCGLLENIMTKPWTFFQTNPVHIFLVIIKRDKIPHFWLEGIENVKIQSNHLPWLCSPCKNRDTELLLADRLSQYAQATKLKSRSTWLLRVICTQCTKLTHMTVCLICVWL